MFNWTTTTIINKLEDYTTKKPLVAAYEKGFAGASATNPVVKIKRDHTFEARYISSIYKAVANDPTLCEMDIDCKKLLALVEDKPAHVRLSFYVALEGSEESIYANDWYQKGKPFSVGFDVTKADDAESIAKKIKKNAEKFGVVTYGKKVFDLTVDSAKLTLKGTHEYQRFKMAAVAIDDVIDEIVVDYFADGEGKTSENEVFTLVNRGINGFGTYHQLVKDLRLPTAHHNKWLQLKEDEKPVVGAKYNQYIVNYCAPSMANPGFTVVGQHNMSATTHVFWVEASISAAFEAALGTVVAGLIQTVTPVTENDVVVVKASTDAGTKYSTNHEQKVVHKEAEDSDKVAKA